MIIPHLPKVFQALYWFCRSCLRLFLLASHWPPRSSRHVVLPRFQLDASQEESTRWGLINFGRDTGHWWEMLFLSFSGILLRILLNATGWYGTRIRHTFLKNMIQQKVRIQTDMSEKRYERDIGRWMSSLRAHQKFKLQLPRNWAGLVLLRHRGSWGLAD